MKNRLFLVASMGLGLGLGVSVAVLQPSIQVQAVPDFLIREHVVSTESIAIPTLGKEYLVSKTKTTVVREVSSQGLGTTNSVVLEAQDRNMFLSGKGLKIGDSLVVTGSNNGRYTYTVTQIRSIELGQEAELYSDTQSELVLLVKQYPWSQTQLALIGSSHR